MDLSANASTKLLNLVYAAMINPQSGTFTPLISTAISLPDASRTFLRGALWCLDVGKLFGEVARP